MRTKVCKFGGTSLADAGQFRKVAGIVADDPLRRVVVPSAPGRRDPDDQKVTDLLYLCAAHAEQHLPFDEVFQRIESRFDQIVRRLSIGLDLTPTLAEIKAAIATGEHGPDYAASRGEYLSGMILAELLGYHFIDPAELIRFNPRGALDLQETQQRIAKRLNHDEPAVIPGFYGATPDGRIKTFSRGGSDITGAIVAAAIKATVYENWTDVSGLLMADPRVVDSPRVIDTITYRELRELAYMGATVMHDEAIYPARQAGVPVNVRNTNDPGAPGTMIVAGSQAGPPTAPISGVAGRKDFTVIAVEKALMNQELGFGRRLLNVLEVNDVSFEHMPSGIDTMSVVVGDTQLDGKLDQVLSDIRQECHPDVLEVYPDMALIATVGRGMSHAPGSAARLFSALAGDGINIRMIDQGSSEINIIVGVETEDFERAVRAIYAAFVG